MLEFLYFVTVHGNPVRINPQYIESVYKDPAQEGTRIDMISGSFYAVTANQDEIMHRIKQLDKK